MHQIRSDGVSCGREEYVCGNSFTVYFMWGQNPEVLSFQRIEYTGCFRRDLVFFGLKFFRVIYIDITKHACNWSWKFTEIMKQKMWSSCSSTYCRCCACCVIRIQRRSALEPITKRSQAMQRRMCYVKYLETYKGLLWN